MSSTAVEPSRQTTAVATASDQASANLATVAAATEQLHASTNEISRQVTQSAEFARTAVVEADRTNARYYAHDAVVVLREALGHHQGFASAF